MALFKSYQEPGVYVQTKIAPRPTVGFVGPFIPCLIGTVDPSTKKSVKLTHSGTTGVDVLLTENGPVAYASFDTTRPPTITKDETSTLTYVQSPMGFPVISQVNVLTSGGTMTAGNYEYVVVAVKEQGSENIYTESETIQATIPTGVTTGSIRVTFSAVTGATKYRLYGRNKNAISGYIEVSAPTTTIIDTGDTLTSGTLPTILADYFIYENNQNLVAIQWTKSARRIVPQLDDTYYVTFYQIKSASDYAPKFFFQYQESEAYDFVGVEQWDSAAQAPKYSLPLGVRLAFANGASGVWCVPIAPSDTMNTIISKLTQLKNPLPYAIVFLKGYIQGATAPNLTDADVTQILSHIMSMSSLEEQKERIGIFGPYKNAYSSSNILSVYQNTLTILKNQRVVYLYPSNISVLIENVERVVDGFYLGAALAGALDSVPMNVPLTGIKLAGIVKVDDNQISQILNKIAGQGTLIVTNSFAVRHALTTDMTNDIVRELKIIRVIDYITRLVRESLRSFVNTPFTSANLSAIGSTVKLLLSQLVNAEILEDYRDIRVVRNQVDRNRVDVSYEFRPVGDITYIVVTSIIPIN